MNIRHHEEQVSSMAFREKTAWISLISIAAIYGAYFVSIIRRHDTVHVGGLLGTMVALVVVQTALKVAVAIQRPREARAQLDERERLIELRATHMAYAAISMALACVCFFGAFEPPILFNTNALVFILVMVELMRSVCQIVQYRRGA
jgi:hypothetical protein